MAPSVIGSSYCLPVRLSVIVSVSAIEERAVRSVSWVVRGGWDGIAGDAVAPVGPARQVLDSAPLAAERPPPLVHRAGAAQDARRCLAHPIHSTSGETPDRKLRPERAGAFEPGANPAQPR